MQTAYPFGMRQIVLTPIDDEDTESLGTPVALPAARTLTFTEAESFETLRGNDKNITTRGTGPEVSWELEGGGYSDAVIVTLYGGTLTETGTTPDAVGTIQKKATDQRPWFRAEGRAITGSSGDLHVLLYRCKATGDFEGEFSDGSWFLTNASGEAFPSQESGNEDALYDIIQNETAEVISES